MEQPKEFMGLLIDADTWAEAACLFFHNGPVVILKNGLKVRPIGLSWEQACDKWAEEKTRRDKINRCQNVTGSVSTEKATV